jgi:dolichol-phosphate mannosyltransferase
VAAYAWLRRDGARPGFVAWAAYLALVGCLAAPWFIAFSVRDPAFAYQFFVEHHLRRFLGEDFHAGPIWFYLPVLCVGCLPWSFLFPALVRFLFARAPAAGALRPAALGFYLLWAVWGVLFFSLSRGKLPPYILPALPAVAVLVGCYLDPVLAGAPGRFFRRAAVQAPRAAVAVLAVAWLGVNAWALTRGLEGLGAARLIAEMALCVACLAGALWWGARLRPRAAWAVCAAFNLLLLLEVSNGLVPAWAARCSPLPAAADLGRWLGDRRTAVVCWGDEWGSVAFHLDRGGLFLSGTHCSRVEFKRFLEQHRRNLVITKNEIDADHLRAAAPAGMQVSQVAESHRTRIFLVRTVN